MELEKRVKLDRESWADYGDSLSQLTSKAFSTLQDKAQEQIALNYYMNQLKDPQISLAVKQQQSEDIREAVSATVEFNPTYILSVSPSQTHHSSRQTMTTLWLPPMNPHKQTR